MSDVEFFGERPDRGDAIYVTGDNSGFAFSFTGRCLLSQPRVKLTPTGAGVSIRGPAAFNETSSWAVYFNETSPPLGNIEPYARYNVTGGKGRGGTIFFAAALPDGEHRVLVVREQGELGTRSHEQGDRG